jgi:hypothetical protein
MFKEIFGKEYINRLSRIHAISTGMIKGLKTSSDLTQTKINKISIEFLTTIANLSKIK